MRPLGFTGATVNAVVLLVVQGQRCGNADGHDRCIYGGLSLGASFSTRHDAYCYYSNYTIHIYTYIMLFFFLNVFTTTSNAETMFGWPWASLRAHEGERCTDGRCVGAVRSLRYADEMSHHREVKLNGGTLRCLYE